MLVKFRDEFFLLKIPMDFLGGTQARAQCGAQLGRPGWKFFDGQRLFFFVHLAPGLCGAMSEIYMALLSVSPTQVGSLPVTATGKSALI